MRRHITASFLLLALLMVVAAVLTTRVHSHRASSAATTLSPATAAVPLGGNREDDRSKAKAVSGSAPESRPLGTHERKDYWEYAHQLLPAARSGDANAEYSLYWIQLYCYGNLQSYFRDHDRTLTLDEGLVKAAGRDQSNTAQEVFDHCHAFQNTESGNDLGDADDWLAKASRGGQPIAQAVTASQALFIASDNESEAITPRIKLVKPASAQAMDAPRALLHQAVQSLDPNVLEIIGQSQYALNPPGPTLWVNQLAWVYVACQRGLDCSPSSHWATDCPNPCNVSSPGSIIMAWSREAWPDVQQAAIEINSKLDAGAWDQLGLGP